MFIFIVLIVCFGYTPIEGEFAELGGGIGSVWHFPGHVRCEYDPEITEMVIGVREFFAVELEVVAVVEILSIFLRDHARSPVVKVAGRFVLDELAEAFPRVIKIMLSITRSTCRVVAAPELEVADVGVAVELRVAYSRKRGDAAELNLASEVDCEPARDRSLVNSKEVRRFRLSGAIPQTFDRV